MINYIPIRNKMHYLIDNEEIIKKYLANYIPTKRAFNFNSKLEMSLCRKKISNPVVEKIKKYMMESESNG